MRIYIVAEAGDNKTAVVYAHKVIKERIMPTPSVMLVTTNTELVRELLSQAECLNSTGHA